MGSCCVEGCTTLTEGTVFFEFPTSRSLRRKWLDMIKIPSKVPAGTVVCSQHFNPDDYEVVRGKVRLKRKVVPSLKLSGTSKQPSPEPETKPQNTVLPGDTLPEKDVDLPQPDSTTGNTEKKTDASITQEEKEDSCIPEDICTVVSKKSGTSEKDPVRLPPIPDLKQPPDFEEMITNYQIKNSKPNTLLSEERESRGETEMQVGEAGPIVLDDKNDAPPVYIEISADKDNTAANTSQDCLMVLESVQVEVDPSALMLPEREFEEVDLVAEGSKDETVKKDDPISLLTSSDEDDVIIQEPHIDTVEVSDETDEDDMPLVKLVKKPSKKKKKGGKLPDVNPEAIRDLLWSGVYGFYCVECQFRTVDSMEYTMHLRDHHKILQVCHVCNYTSASKTQFSRHLRKHKEEKKFKCHLCEYRARHNMSLIYHMQCHKQDKKKSVKYGFKCKKCGFKSDDKKLALNHLKVCDDSVAMFSCDYCDYTTKRKTDLKRHIISSGHRGESDSDSYWN